MQVPVYVLYHVHDARRFHNPTSPYVQFHTQDPAVALQASAPTARSMANPHRSPRLPDHRSADLEILQKDHNQSFMSLSWAHLNRAFAKTHLPPAAAHKRRKRGFAGITCPPGRVPPHPGKGRLPFAIPLVTVGICHEGEPVTTRPGVAPVCCPFLTTRVPFTQTSRMPVESWCASSNVARSLTVSALKMTTSA
jgi:hypothetical protein